MTRCARGDALIAFSWKCPPVDRRCGLLLGVGASGQEPSFAHAEGGDVLEQRLRLAGVFPYTDVRRKAVLT